MAWAYILEATPMMANPHEYREALWSILHDGVAPPTKTEKTTGRRSRKALPPARRGMTSHDKVELSNFMKQIDQIKQDRAS